MTVDDVLRPLLPARDRAAVRRVPTADPDATVGHLVQAAGVPLTEVRTVLVDGVPAPRDARPLPGATISVRPVPRPHLSRCPRCGRVHRRGAYARRIDALVERARRVTGGRQRDEGPRSWPARARGRPRRVSSTGQDEECPPSLTEETPCPSTCSRTCPTTTGHWSRTSPAASWSCTTTSTTRPT
ncbi:hypothetical protein [Geodermatophilus amargosae]|uniref:hypothetical protein n=1 Tax=Geodermatophilus amargosae TaxID=1296565 RepID=UPI0034DEA02F